MPGPTPTPTDRTRVTGNACAFVWRSRQRVTAAGCPWPWVSRSRVTAAGCFWKWSNRVIGNACAFVWRTRPRVRGAGCLAAWASRLRQRGDGCPAWWESQRLTGCGGCQCPRPCRACWVTKLAASSPTAYATLTLSGLPAVTGFDPNGDRTLYCKSQYYRGAGVANGLADADAPTTYPGTVTYPTGCSNPGLLFTRTTVAGAGMAADPSGGARVYLVLGDCGPFASGLSPAGYAVDGLLGTAPPAGYRLVGMYYRTDDRRVVVPDGLGVCRYQSGAFDGTTVWFALQLTDPTPGTGDTIGPVTGSYRRLDRSGTFTGFDVFGNPAWTYTDTETFGTFTGTLTLSCGGSAPVMMAAAAPAQAVAATEPPPDKAAQAEAVAAALPCPDRRELLQVSAGCCDAGGSVWRCAHPGVTGKRADGGVVLTPQRGVALDDCQECEFRPRTEG